MIWAVLPLKDFGEAKQRLGGCLTPAERRALFQAMVEDVLAVLRACDRLSGVAVLSDDPTARRLAERYGVQCWLESSLGRGLNGVVAGAGRKLASMGVELMLVVHGDLPLLNQRDLNTLIDAHLSLPGSALSAVPDRAGTGSNCLLLSPPDALVPRFGTDSFQAHEAAAQAQGLIWNPQPLAALGGDIDSPEDLAWLIEQPQLGGHSRDYLQASGIARRLQQAAINEPMPPDAENGHVSG